MATETMDATHRRAWDLIPWVVAGSADEADRALVDQHLLTCPDCRDEYAFQRNVHQAMTAGRPLPHAADAGLSRLLSRIDASTTPAEAAEPARANGRRPVAVRWLAALAVVQAVGLGTMAGVLWGRTTRPAEYQTLSQVATAPVQASIQFVPAPTLTVAELRQALEKSRLRIVESSSDGGILGLSPQLAGAPVSLDEHLRLLRAQPGVLLAEPSAVAASSRVAPK